MNSDKLMRLERELEATRKAFEAAGRAYSEQKVAECDHEWRDESFDNGHNGDEITVFRCRLCASKCGKDPR